MKIGEISKKPTFWSTKAILASIKVHGHEPFFIKTDDVRLTVATGDDPYVQEVNAPPGFCGLLEATKVNVADVLVEYVIEKAG